VICGFITFFHPLLCADALRVALRNSPALTPTIPEVAVHDGRGYANHTSATQLKAVKDQLRAQGLNPMQWMLGRSVPRQIDLAQYSDEVIEKVAKTVQGSELLRALSDSETFIRPNTPCNIGSWDRRGRVLRASMSLVVIGFAASVSTAAAQYLPPQPPPVGYPPPAYYGYWGSTSVLSGQSLSAVRHSALWVVNQVRTAELS
jgi:hypothetical protein